MMKKHIQKYLSVYITGGAFLCVLLFFENLFSNSFAGCINQYGKSQAAINSKDGGIVVSQAVAQIACSVHFINFHVGFFSIIAGILVAVFTYNLVKSTDALWKASENQRRDSRRAIFASLAAAKAARKSAEVARDEFIATHRPKVIVRRVSLHEGTPTTAPVGRPWKIQYILANVGGSDAIIVEGNATIKVYTGELPSIPEFEDTADVHPGLRLVPGQSAPLNAHFDDALAQRISFILKTPRRTGPECGDIYFLGFFRYKDPVGAVIRRTAFCRRYNIESQRFAAVDDDDYEYQD